jgi:hypothetical protein
MIGFMRGISKKENRMFTHMIHIKNGKHSARNVDYELLIYQVEETGEYRIYIAKNGMGVGDIYTASDEVVKDAKHVHGEDIVEQLINIAKSDIDRNEFNQEV